MTCAWKCIRLNLPNWGQVVQVQYHNWQTAESFYCEGAAGVQVHDVHYCYVVRNHWAQTAHRQMVWIYICTFFFFFSNNGTFLISYITVDWNTPDFRDSRVSCSVTSSTSHRAAAHTVIVKTVRYTDFTHLLTAVTPFSGLWQSNLWSCHHNFELHLIFLSGILLWHCKGWKSLIRKLDLHRKPMLWSAPSSGWCLQFWFVLFRFL